MSASQPLVSIITVVYNGEMHLEKTIKSIVAQTYTNIEYIIIDGASTDGTLNIIKKHQADISFWKSEPDKGIYDAMNKGLDAAKGDYIWFINAGDEIYDKETLSGVFKDQEDRADVYYGETEDVNERGEKMGMRRLKVPEQLSWKSLSKGMVVCHQSIIISRELAPHYNLKYRLASDIDWIISILKKSHKIKNTGLVLSKFQTGGVSRNNIIKSLKERFSIMRKHYGAITTVFNHFLIGGKFLLFVIRHRRF